MEMLACANQYNLNPTVELSESMLSPLPYADSQVLFEKRM
jgi:hypothetical protein